MIRRPSDWDSVKEGTNRRKLPAGAYVCRIRSAQIVSSEYGEQLQLSFDIADGEFAGYFEEDFRSNPAEIKKWRGLFRQFLPKDDGSEKDGWTKSALKGFITSVERSNRGYLWNWDEASLKGKLVGIIFRNEEWSYEGKMGWTARPYRACSVDSVADGTFYMPKDKPLSNKPSVAAVDSFAPASSGGYVSFADTEDELPF